MHTDTKLILLGIPAACIIGALFGYRLGIITCYKRFEENVRQIHRLIMELEAQKGKVSPHQ